MKCKENKKMKMEKALIKNDLENKNKKKNQVNQAKIKTNKNSKMNNYKIKIQIKNKEKKALKRGIRKDK